MIKKVNAVLVGILLLFICINLNIGNVTMILIEKVYPQKYIYNTDIISNSEYLKDFEIKGDNSLLSKSSNPWIYLNNNQFKFASPFSISINVQLIGKETESIHIYNTDGYNGVFGDIISGTNNFKLAQGSIISEGLRIDLATTKDTNIYVDSIVINDGIYIYSLLRECLNVVIFILITILILLFIYSIFNKYKPKIIFNKLIKIKNIEAYFVLFMYCFGSIFELNYFFIILGLSGYAVVKALRDNTLDNFFLTSKKKGVYILIYIISIVFLVISNYYFLYKYNILSGESNKSHSKILFLLLFVLLYYLLEIINLVNNKDTNRHFNVRTSIVAIIYIVSELLIIYLREGSHFQWEVSYIVNILLTDILFLNIFFVILLYLFWFSLLGGVLTNCLTILYYLVIISGNIVKMKYQDTIFKPTDLLILKDFFSILNKYISDLSILMLVTVFLFMILTIFLYVKKKGLNFKPHWNRINFILVTPLLAILFYQLNANIFEDIGINRNAPWWEPKSIEKAQGLAIYNYYNFIDLKDLILSKPEDYNEESIRLMLKGYNHKNESKVKPNVVLIMAESLFDLEKIEHLNITPTITNTIKRYQKSNIVSPRFGGGTAAVEFEALTGLSNYFFLDDTIVYTTYINDKNRILPGLAYEFEKNDYETFAIHPNTDDFYNRKLVYSNMKFDEFISISDFFYLSDPKLNDGYISDEVFFNKVKELLNDSSNPKFIWGVTIAGHAPYENKYEETVVNVDSVKLNEKEIKEVEQYAQTLYDIDKEIKILIEYIEGLEQPTLLYIFGDHLPQLNFFNDDDYFTTGINKYVTPFIAYSNYKDILVEEEYITPNYIASQILNDSQINYLPYYNYIEKMREEFPVIQRAIDPNNDRQLKNYYKLIYDLIFGEQYALKIWNTR